jgi:plastocyanin
MTSVHPSRALIRAAGVAGFSALAVVVVAAWASSVAAAPRAESEFGTIKGRLIWGGTEVPAPKMLPVNKDPEICGNMPVVSKALLVDPKNKGVGNAFAYLLNPSGANPEAEKELLTRAPEVVIDQKKCAYIPYSTAMNQNQTLVFKSSDPTNHNVHYTAITNNAFNQILPPNGQAKVRLVAEKNPIPLTCDLHDWMKGAIMVFNHPFFDVTKEDGSFEIQGVPAGDQNLIVRLASGLYMTPGANHAIKVKVEAGKTTDVEVKIDPTLIR